MEAITLKVQGMSCGGCVSSVTKILSAMAGVTAVSVRLAEGEASMQIDPARVSLDQIRHAIEDAGFEVA